MFEELIDKFEKHCFILIRIIEPGLEKSVGCTTQSFDKTSSFLSKAEARISMTFRHKSSDEAGELERVAVVRDGQSGFHGWELVELGDVSVELSHGGPNFMRTELDQCGL